ncbi:MAG: hypothetical protein PVG49_03155 [Desulfobacteraceae bacterium]|jgi:hypothetical protein
MRDIPNPPRKRILLSALISLVLYGAFFFHLVRLEHKVLLARQGALESLGLLTVPGTDFLNGIGAVFLLKSTLFFLVLLGVTFVVLQFVSLCLRRPWTRLVFLCAVLGGLIFLLREDRVWFSFPLVTALSFASFFLLTLDEHIPVSRNHLGIFLVLCIVASLSLFLGEKRNFFVKARDRLLFDSALGSRISSYYYTYSPLAASVISPAQGVYEGLVYREHYKERPFLHLANGIVLSGKESVAQGADFRIGQNGSGMILSNRYGDRIPIASADVKTIQAGVKQLFTMNGFKQLTRISLYAFPAGLLLGLFLCIRMFTANPWVFLGVGGPLCAAAVILIAVISLQGHRPDLDSQKNLLKHKTNALATAYHFYDQNRLPDEALPMARDMLTSDSIALRYWGAKLLGVYGFNSTSPALLVDRLEDLSPNVRYAAALSLYRILGEASFRILLPRLLKEPNWYVRCMIFSTFLQSGTIPHRA